MSKLERLKKDVADAEAAFCRADVLASAVDADAYDAACDAAYVKYLAVKLATKTLNDYLEEQRFTIPKIEGFKLLELPAVSGWECYLFGSARGLTLIPKKGDVPNWFWRKMQRKVNEIFYDMPAS